MSKRMPSWVKNVLMFGGISASIILFNAGCKPLQNMRNKKTEKKQAEYNEIYNKAYTDITRKNDSIANVNSKKTLTTQQDTSKTRKNDSIANVNSKKTLTTQQDTSKCLFFIIGDGKIHSK